MIPISRTVETLVLRSPLLTEALSRGILNLSALARELKPAIDEKHMGDVTTSSVIMALKRLEPRVRARHKAARSGWHVRNITVESSFTEYVFVNSQTLPQFHRKLLALMEKSDDVCVHYSQGINETIVLASSVADKVIRGLAKDERLLRTFPGLSMVTLMLSEGTADIPGVYDAFIKALAWEGIALVELLSISSELTFLFHDADVERAFAVLKAASKRL
jgi:aspartokinase